MVCHYPKLNWKNYLQANAYKLAKIKIKDNLGIETLVYNVNMARNMLVDELYNYPAHLKKLEHIFSQLLNIIDRFTFHLISHYCAIKSNEWREKSPY